MNFKKITSIIAIALTVVATSTTLGQGVYAAEKISNTTSTSTNATKITKHIDTNTVITKDNMSDVLTYLGLDPNKLVEGNKAGQSVGTVGELQKAIEQAKKQKITVKTQKTVPNKSNDTKNVMKATAFYDDDDDTPTSSQRVYEDLNCDDYKVEFSCVGSYRHGQWCGVGSEDAELTNIQQGFFSYAITSKNDLSAEYTSDRITMHHDIEVTSYVGIGQASYPVTVNPIKGYDYFNIDDWV